MASINLNRVNEYINNYYDQIQLGDLDKLHTDQVKEWFKENLSVIGRYGHRDFERFGRLKSNDGNVGRQDGWVALSEEVPSLDQLTFGTGVLYIHGEMETPDGDKIENDEYNHVDKSGTHHIYEDTTKPKRFLSSGSENGVSYGDQGENGAADPRQPGGFVWKFEEEDRPSGDGDDQWRYESITDCVGGDRIEEKTATPEAEKETPAVFNDEDVYHLDNERNNYPFVIVQSAQPQSIKDFLEENMQGKNGMYDDELPSLAQSSYPPTKGIKVDVDAIVEYISPLEDK